MKEYDLPGDMLWRMDSESYKKYKQDFSERDDCAIKEKEYAPLPRYLRRAIWKDDEKLLKKATGRAIKEGWTPNILRKQFRKLLRIE